MFVCLLGSGKYRLIFNIKLNKNKYITLVGAPRAPKKEPNAGIGEIISPIASATSKKKYLSIEGFEPSPCYRIAPEATALDRSAKLTCCFFNNFS